jgi:hypothetical protein
VSAAGQDVFRGCRWETELTSRRCEYREPLDGVQHGSYRWSLHVGSASRYPRGEWARALDRDGAVDLDSRGAEAMVFQLDMPLRFGLWIPFRRALKLRRHLLRRRHDVGPTRPRPYFSQTCTVLTRRSGFGVGGNVPIDATITLEFLPKVRETNKKIEG